MKGRSAEAIKRADEATENVAREMEKVLRIWGERQPNVAQSSVPLADRLREATRAKRSGG